MKKIIDIFLALSVVVATLYFSFYSYSSAKNLEQIDKSYYEAKSDISDLIKRRFNSVLSTVTLGTVKIESKKSINLDKLTAKKIILKEKNSSYLIYLAVAVGVGLLLYFLLDSYTFALMSAIVSITTLLFGIFTPILLIVIHKNVEYLGDIVLSFESKTIVGTIEHLYHNGNYPVALTILLFSVIVPFIKSLSMLLVLVWKRMHIATKLVKLFKSLGKWSMLDVFVVSLLLVYLSAGSSANSYSKLESGTYIFLIYVIYSIITSIVVTKYLDLRS